jgi:hypothetical protein
MAARLGFSPRHQLETVQPAVEHQFPQRLQRRQGLLVQWQLVQPVGGFQVGHCAPGRSNSKNQGKARGIASM